MWKKNYQNKRKRRILYFDYQNTVNSDTQTCTFSLNLGKKHYEWPNVDYVKHAN